MQYKKYIDGANPSFIKSLKIEWGERSDYENVKKEHRQFMKVQPVNFNQEHKEMLGHCKMLLERGYIGINPTFDKLKTSLRTAEAEENILDKESTSYCDVFDAYRLALKHYQFITKEVEDNQTVKAKPSPIRMPNIPTRVGRYCVFHGIIHKDEYLECDFCNEHKDWICSKDRYYKYGFSKRSYLACMECHHLLFGPFRVVDCDNMMRAYEDILKVINDRTVVKVKGGNEIIDYYEAVRIALIESEYMRRHFDPVIKNTTQINKMFKPIWEFTYKIVSGEEWKRVKVVNRDPDNLLVQWVPGGKTITEILKEMNKGCRSILYT